MNEMSRKNLAVFKKRIDKLNLSKEEKAEVFSIVEDGEKKHDKWLKEVEAERWKAGLNKKLEDENG